MPTQLSISFLDTFISHFSNQYSLYFFLIPSLNGLLIETSRGWRYRISPYGIIITFVSLSSKLFLISGILCTDSSSNTSIFFFLSLKWAYFLHTKLIHFFITSLLFQAFFCQNANNCLLSTRGCFSSSFAILPFGFPLNTTTGGNFVPSATIHNITVTRTFIYRDF